MGPHVLKKGPFIELPFPAAAGAPVGGERPPAPSPRDTAPALARPRDVVSVAELDRRLRRVVEGATEGVTVGGEVSGFKEVASGHQYFTLKDEREDASIECVMYRTAPLRARRLLRDGARVVLVGRATVYAPRGRLQLCAEDARPAGRGALLEALEARKLALAAEGLFLPERKRPLPTDPRVIGVVTSADGAAIHDIVRVAFRRGGVRLVLARAPVQGPTAAQRIARAIAALERVPGMDVIVIGRGGGSADDLAAYNEEVLVRKVASALVPVVSAVGHEIDTTLTDLAADARAATPSQAAEMLVPDAVARRAALDHLRARMRRALTHELATARGDVRRLRAALGSPAPVIAERQQRLDEAMGRLAAASARAITRRRADLARAERRLGARHPSAVLAGARAELGPLEARLGAAMVRRLASGRSALASRAAQLDALSPLRVLARGYAIVQASSGRAVRDSAEVAVGDDLSIRLDRGGLSARVTAVTPAGEPGPGEPRDA